MSLLHLHSADASASSRRSCSHRLNLWLRLLDWIQARGELQSVLAFLPIGIRNGQTDAHWLRASDGSKRCTDLLAVAHCGKELHWTVRQGVVVRGPAILCNCWDRDTR